jgi:hypothetical protein
MGEEVGSTDNLQSATNDQPAVQESLAEETRANTPSPSTRERRRHTNAAVMPPPPELHSDRSIVEYCGKYSSTCGE